VESIRSERILNAESEIEGTGYSLIVAKGSKYK